MVKKILAALVLLDHVSWASCPDPPGAFPSQAVTIVGLQGRPIYNAQVTVVGYTTGLQVPVWVDKLCVTPLQIVPASGILQFFAAPGEYQVTVSGEGLTKVFDVGVLPGSSDPNRISYSWSPNELQYFTSDLSHQAALVTDSYAMANYGEGADTCAHLQFQLPSFPVVLSSSDTIWHTPFSGDGSKVAYRITTCHSQPGTDFCSAGTVNYTNAITIGAGAQTPSALTIPGASLGGTTWSLSDIIRIDLCRDGASNPMDHWDSDFILDNFRLEFERQ